MKLVVFLLGVCALAQTPALTTGAQRTIAVPVNFSDAPSPCAFTGAQLGTTLFGNDPRQLSGYYSGSTSGRIWFAGDAAECVTLPTALTQCYPTVLPDIMSAVERVLVSRGYNLDAYNRRFLALPGTLPCAMSAIVTQGATSTTAGGTQYSSAWFGCSANPYSTTVPVACHSLHHEMGHNLGMAHACLVGEDPQTCYGDNSDVMGRCGADLCGFNAPHWYQMGWASPQDVTASGTYTIGVLDTTGELLRVPALNYYLSLRKTGIAAVHHWPGVSVTALAQTLGVGQTFSTTGLSVTLLAQTATTATFNVQLGGTAPPPLPPPPPTSLPPVITPTSAELSWKQSVMFTADQPVTWSMTGYGTLNSPLARSVIYTASGNPRGGKAEVTAINAAGQSAKVTVTVTRR